MGRGYLSELERGLVIPTIATLIRVANVLDVSVGDLILIGDSPRELVFAATRGLAPAVLRRLAKDLRKLTPVARTE